MGCGNPELSDDNPPTLLNPAMFAEVLSKTNTDHEIMLKLNFHCAIDSLSDVLVMDSESILVRQVSISSIWRDEDVGEGEFNVGEGEWGDFVAGLQEALFGVGVFFRVAIDF